MGNERKKSSTQKRNQRRRIKQKRDKTRDADSPSIGSAAQDKKTLIPGALSEVTELTMEGRMIRYDRKVWGVTDEIKAKTVKVNAKFLDHEDPKIALIASRNFIAMEAQELEAAKQRPESKPNDQPLPQFNTREFVEKVADLTAEIGTADDRDSNERRSVVGTTLEATGDRVIEAGQMADSGSEEAGEDELDRLRLAR